jgi:uncharacterized protein YegP (UPF0339 family)
MAKFEVYQNKKNLEYRFRMKASNGQIILSSEGYKSKKACLNGIESVKSNAKNPKRYNKTQTTSGAYRFALVAGNKEIIGISQNYKSVSGRNNGVKSVMKNAVKAAITEL